MFRPKPSNHPSTKINPVAITAAIMLTIITLTLIQIIATTTKTTAATTVAKRPT